MINVKQIINDLAHLRRDVQDRITKEEFKKFLDIKSDLKELQTKLLTIGITLGQMNYHEKN